VPLPTSTTATAAQPPQLPASAPGLFEVASSLVLVVGVVFALAFVLRRLQNVRAGTPGNVVIRGGVQVGARERVLLVESSGRRLLIGVAPGSVRTLHVFDPSEVAALPEPASALPVSGAAFAEKLKALLGKQGGS
jgi:flagellar protein FliO/FliZ